MKGKKIFHNLQRYLHGLLCFLDSFECLDRRLVLHRVVGDFCGKAIGWFAALSRGAGHGRFGLFFLLFFVFNRVCQRLQLASCP